MQTEVALITTKSMLIAMSKRLLKKFKKIKKYQSWIWC